MELLLELEKALIEARRDLISHLGTTLDKDELLSYSGRLYATSGVLQMIEEAKEMEKEFEKGGSE